MVTFKLVGHVEIDEHFQGINLTEFIYFSNESLSDEELLNTFIHSEHFTFDSLRDIVRLQTEEHFFLNQLFVSDQISNRDFKAYTKRDIVRFLDDYWNADNPEDEERADFLVLMNKFFELIGNVESDLFYLINRDWFEEEDEKVRLKEFLAYSYYFLILWIDKTKNGLTITEWTYA